MKGILFKPWKIKAIADSPLERIWQTRRVIKPQPSGDIWFPNTDFHVCTMPKSCSLILSHARYQVGEVVYIKEAWRYYGGEEYEYLREPECVIYRYDVLVNRDIYKWRNPHTMPVWAARHFLKITDVKAERLQEISSPDIHTEGLPSIANYATPIQWFIAVWNTINKRPYDWQANPYVFVYSFKKVEV